MRPLRHINQSFITPEGSKIKTHIQYTVKVTKKQYTHLKKSIKKHLKHLYKYGTTLQKVLQLQNIVSYERQIS